MKVIELNGLPGSGKSTICDSLLKDERYQDLSIGTKADLYQNRIGIITKAVLLFLSLFMLETYYIVRFSLRYKITRERLRRTLKLIHLNVCLSRVIKKEPFDVLLLEEGLVQYITSIPHEYEIKVDDQTERFIHLLLYKYRGIKVVNCNIQPRSSYTRIKKRTIPSPRFDKLESGELMKLLNMKDYNLEVVRGHLKFNYTVSLDMERDVSENTNILVDLILR